MLVHFNSSLVFNLCLFPYVKASMTTNFWEQRTSSPPTQSWNTPGSPAIFPLKTELAERSEHTLSFSLSFCFQQSRRSSYKSKYFPTNMFSEMEFQARKSTTCCISRKSDLENICTVATYLEILMG